MSDSPPPRTPAPSHPLEAHLEFFEELGVNGVRMDPVWRERPADGDADRGASLARLAGASVTRLAPQDTIVSVYASEREALAAIREALARRDELRAKGLAHASQFSWRRAGEVFLEGYERFA